jgi:dUTP pyrophosphatase
MPLTLTAHQNPATAMPAVIPAAMPAAMPEAIMITAGDTMIGAGEAVTNTPETGPGAEAVTLKITKADPRIPLPRYESGGAAGMDLRAYLDGDVQIQPLGRAKIPTGLQVEIPCGYEGQVRPRSGLAFKFGVTVLNAPGTIDCDYRGSLDVILVNLGAEAFTVKNGDRIAQLVIAPVLRARVAEEGELSLTARGAGGFGSTGTE